MYTSRLLGAQVHAGGRLHPSVIYAHESGSPDLPKGLNLLIPVGIKGQAHATTVRPPLNTPTIIRPAHPAADPQHVHAATRAHVPDLQHPAAMIVVADPRPRRQEAPVRRQVGPLDLDVVPVRVPQQRPRPQPGRRRPVRRRHAAGQFMRIQQLTQAKQVASNIEVIPGQRLDRRRQLRPMLRPSRPERFKAASLPASLPAPAREHRHQLGLAQHRDPELAGRVDSAARLLAREQHVRALVDPAADLVSLHQRGLGRGPLELENVPVNTTVLPWMFRVNVRPGTRAGPLFRDRPLRGSAGQRHPGPSQAQLEADDIPTNSRGPGDTPLAPGADHHQRYPDRREHKRGRSAGASTQGGAIVLTPTG